MIDENLEFHKGPIKIFARHCITNSHYYDSVIKNPSIFLLISCLCMWDKLPIE